MSVKATHLQGSASNGDEFALGSVTLDCVACLDRHTVIVSLAGRLQQMRTMRHTLPTK